MELSWIAVGGVVVLAILVAWLRGGQPQKGRKTKKGLQLYK